MAGTSQARRHSGTMHGFYASQGGGPVRSLTCACNNDPLTCKMLYVANPRSTCGTCTKGLHRAHNIGCAKSRWIGKTHADFEQKKQALAFAKARRIGNSPTRDRGMDVAAEAAASIAATTAASAAASAATASSSAGPPGQLVVVAAAAAAAAVTTTETTPPVAPKFQAMLPGMSDAVVAFVSTLPKVDKNCKILGAAAVLKPFRLRKTLMPRRTQSHDVPMYATTLPDANAHMMRGFTLHAVRWSYLGVDIGKGITCPDCSLPLHGNRGNQYGTWSTSGDSIRPIFDLRNRPAYAVSWRYSPCACGKRWNSLDAEIMIQIEPRFLRQLPFAPAFARANGSILLSRHTTNAILDDCVTYQSFARFASKVSGRIGELFETHRMDYHDHITAYRKETSSTQLFEPWPTFERWIGRKGGAPTPAVYKKSFLSYYYGSSNITLGEQQMSVDEALARAMQGSDAGNSAVSLDHTFAAAKNLRDDKVKQLFDVVSEDYELQGWVYTKSTALREIIHFLECLVHRPKYFPSTSTTDDYPANHAMWDALLPLTPKMLGIWHVMHRVTECLDKSNAAFGRACSDLSRAVYVFTQVTVNKCDAELMGPNTFGGTAWNTKSPSVKAAAITAMKQSGEYYTKYGPYLAKTTCVLTVLPFVFLLIL